MMLAIGIVVAAVGLLVLSGVLYQWIGGSLDRRRLLGRGRLVTIGEGCQLYLVEKGRGGPAVVFESGFGATSLNWMGIQEGLAERVRSVAYDRCGLGWSSEATSERTPRQVAGELRRLLLAAGVEPPWILVGHSFGGLVMQRFALEYPEETAGVVLLDPMRTEEWPPVNASQSERLERALRLSGVGEHCARFGFTRLAANSHLCGSRRLSGWLIRMAGARGEYLAGRLDEEISKMPAQVRPSIAAQWSTPRFYRGLRAHLRAVPATVEEMHTAAPIRKAPVVVITPGKPRLIEEMEKFGPNSFQIVARDSGHWLHLDEPELVIHTILDVVERARSEKRSSADSGAVLQGAD